MRSSHTAEIEIRLRRNRGPYCESHRCVRRSVLWRAVFDRATPTERSRFSTPAACSRPGGVLNTHFPWSGRSQASVRRTGRLATTNVVTGRKVPLTWGNTNYTLVIASLEIASSRGLAAAWTLIRTSGSLCQWARRQRSVGPTLPGCYKRAKSGTPQRARGRGTRAQAVGVISSLQADADADRRSHSRATSAFAVRCANLRPASGAVRIVQCRRIPNATSRCR